MKRARRGGKDPSIKTSQHSVKDHVTNAVMASKIMISIKNRAGIAMHDDGISGLKGDKTHREHHRLRRSNGYWRF